MTRHQDPLRIALRVVVFAVVFYGGALVSTPLFIWLAGYLVGTTFGVLFGALSATWLCLRIYEDVPIPSIGLWWNRASSDNLLLGLAGGVGAACIAVGPPFITGDAHLVWHGAPSGGGIVVAILCLAAGSVGEEIAFRGYGLQLLISKLGPWGAILPVGVVFGVMHAANPDSSRFGIVNTAAFGVVFGYAYLRSRDLWLPIGLHFGWNCTLPAFGGNLSGIKIFKEILGYEVVWNAGPIWSGGKYGPEAGILTSAALVPLFLFLWKAPIRRQLSPFTDPPPENTACEPSQPSQS